MDPRSNTVLDGCSPAPKIQPVCFADWAGRAQAYASTLEIRATRQVLGGPADRQAPIFRQESEGGIRRRMRRQPGGESGWRCCLGMEPSVRAAGTHGARLGGSHHGLGNGGCCEVGEPARVLFDAAARDDQHKYSDGSLRGISRGISLAASGGPPPLEIRGRGGWDTPGFCLGGSCYTLSISFKVHVRVYLIRVTTGSKPPCFSGHSANWKQPSPGEVEDEAIHGRLRMLLFTSHFARVTSPRLGHEGNRSGKSSCRNRSGGTGNRPNVTSKRAAARHRLPL